MALSNKHLTQKIGAIEEIHAVVCDKNKDMDRAGDVIVSLKIEGQWFEILRLTELCNYFEGSCPRSGLAYELIKNNGRPRRASKNDNWNPYD